MIRNQVTRGAIGAVSYTHLDVYKRQLQEIGLTLDVSAARVCQIKRDAMARIDRMMREMTE